MAATREVREIINYAHVREEQPGHWVDVGLSARTLAPGIAKGRLLVMRIDGDYQAWVFSPGATYLAAGVGLIIRGPIYTPIPTIQSPQTP